MNLRRMVRKRITDIQTAENRATKKTMILTSLPAGGPRKRIQHILHNKIEITALKYVFLAV